MYTVYIICIIQIFFLSLFSFSLSLSHSLCLLCILTVTHSPWLSPLSVLTSIMHLLSLLCLHVFLTEAQTNHQLIWQMVLNAEDFWNNTNPSHSQFLTWLSSSLCSSVTVDRGVHQKYSKCTKTNCIYGRVLNWNAIAILGNIAVSKVNTNTFIMFTFPYGLQPSWPL